MNVAPVSGRALFFIYERYECIHHSSDCISVSSSKYYKFKVCKANLPKFKSFWNSLNIARLCNLQRHVITKRDGHCDA